VNYLLSISGGAIAAIVIPAVVIVLAFFILVPLGIWFRAWVSGARVGMGRLVGMRLRKVAVAKLIDAYITGRKAGLDIKVETLETHYMAKGNVGKVIDALISAHSANIVLDIKTAMAIDLAGRDVLKAVQTSVNPRVIETPMISAVAKDGIELKAKAKITVRANIARLIGGAGEETIVARVGEGIVTTIGSAMNHKDVLENPDMISRKVLGKGLDSGTAFEILSIDIADMDVGKNIGSQLQMDQAEADKKIAQARAEERRALAVANEQEMKARTQEMQAMVVAAEAEIPKAMADALRSGKLGIMDYYNMQNIQADTNMRNGLGDGGKGGKKQ
jgi:uncharacterized protein YqfA (UPF0365 family)